MGVVAAVGAARRGELVDERGGRRGLDGERAEHIEANDVAGPLPDGVERRLAVQPRERAVLDVSVAAHALHRLGGHAGRLLQTWYLSTAVARRRSAASVVPSAASKERQRRAHDASAASVSSARSASTARISGCSTSGAPAAARPAACAAACCAHTRISAAEPMTQSRRVCTTISTIVRTPLPGRPTIRAHALSYSTSLDAFERSPIFSFSRIRRKPEFREPSGSQRGTRKLLTPSAVCASVRKRVAHRRAREPLVAAQRVLAALAAVACRRGDRRVARTSEPPPCFSVMLMPIVTPLLFGPSRPSCDGASTISWARHSLATAAVVESAGTAANVIVVGQPWPCSSWYIMPRARARAEKTPRRSRCSPHGSAATPDSSASVISSW